MKKIMLGFVSGVILSATVVTYASDAIKAVAFPAKYIINGQSQELDNKYMSINVNNHVYVPIRFIAESLGLIVNYDDISNIISVNTTSFQDSLSIKDPRIDLIKIDNLSLINDGENTKVLGQIQIIDMPTADINANLSFYNEKDEQIGFVIISGDFKEGIQRFESVGSGNFINYSKMKLNIGSLNGRIIR